MTSFTHIYFQAIDLNSGRMLTYPPLPMSSTDGAVQNAPSLFMNLSTRRHRTTSDPLRDQRNGNHEILHLKNPFDDISKQAFVLRCWWSAQQHYPPILLWIHLHWEFGADITLKVSAPSIGAIASLATHSPQPSSFQPSSPFPSFTAESLREGENWGELCPSLISSMLNIY